MDFRHASDRYRFDALRQAMLGDGITRERVRMACNPWRRAALSLAQADRKRSCPHSNSGLSPLFLRLRCRLRPTRRPRRKQLRNAQLRPRGPQLRGPQPRGPQPRKGQLRNGPPPRKGLLHNGPSLHRERLRNVLPLRKGLLHNGPPPRKERLRNGPPLHATLPVHLWPLILLRTILLAEGRCSIQPETRPAKRTKPSEVTPCAKG